MSKEIKRECQNNVFVETLDISFPSAAAPPFPPAYPHYRQNHLKSRSDRIAHLHKNFPLLSSTECPPVPQLLMPSIIFPQLPFLAYFLPYHPSLLLCPHPPIPMLQPPSPTGTTTKTLCLCAEMLILLCLPPSHQFIENSVFKDLNPMPHPSVPSALL